MGCNCGKNKFPRKKSSRMPAKNGSPKAIQENLTPDQRRSQIVKIQNSRRNQRINQLKQQFDWESYVKENNKRH